MATKIAPIKGADLLKKSCFIILKILPAEGHFKSTFLQGSYSCQISAVLKDGWQLVMLLNISL